MNRNIEPAGRRLQGLGLMLVSRAQQPPPKKNATPTKSAAELRQLIDQQVGGIGKLKVPAKDADIPLPRQPDDTVNARYKKTEAKRYLGTLHDPVRTARVNIN